MLKITRDKIITGKHSSESQRQELINGLNEYRDCFALDSSELGKTKLAEIEIELTDPTPEYYKPYRLSYAERDKVRGIVDNLKESGIVRESAYRLLKNR